MLRYIRERFFPKEEFALEVLISVLKTGRGKKVLDDVVEHLLQREMKRLAEDFAYVRNVYDEKNPVDAFYSAGLLSEETYAQLKIAERKGNLTSSFVSKVLEELRREKGAWGKILKGLSTPLFYTFLASVVLVTMVPNTVTILEKLAPDRVPRIYTFISEHPLLSFFTVFFLSTASVIGIAYLLFIKSTRVPLKLYRLARIGHLLRLQKVSYAEIFSFLSEFERDRFFKALWEDLSLRSRNLPISEALQFMGELLPVTVYLTFIYQLRRGEELSAWEYLKGELEKILENRYGFLSTALPALGFGVLILILLFAILPMFSGIFAIVSLFSRF